MNIDQVAALRALLAPSGWLERTDLFARDLRRYTRTPHGLLVVGTPEDEPWHMTAHLEFEAQQAGLAELEPTLVRWAPRTGAPKHLSVGLERLAEVRRGESLLVVSGEVAPGELLERVHDVRRAGATVFALDRGDPDLDTLANEVLAVPRPNAPLSFDAAQHLVSASVGQPDGPSGGRQLSLRGRLAKLLNSVSGTSDLP